LKTPFLKAFSAYRELMHSGEISSIAEGEYICVDLRGNICGDILVFISPKNRIAEGENVLDFVLSDPKLEEQTKLAFSNFRLKLLGLTLLPTSLIWLLNIGISSLFLNRYYGIIHTSVARNGFVDGIIHILPVLILTVITVLYGKDLGFKILKPVFKIVTWLIRKLKWIRNKKVFESQG
jgi:hypothetical protein